MTIRKSHGLEQVGNRCIKRDESIFLASIKSGSMSNNVHPGVTGHSPRPDDSTEHDVEYQKWQFMAKRTLEVIVVAHIALFQAQ